MKDLSDDGVPLARTSFVYLAARVLSGFGQPIRLTRSSSRRCGPGPERTAGPSFRRCASMILLAAWLPALALAQESRPILRFAFDKTILNSNAFIWRKDHPWHEDGHDATRSERYFDKLRVENGGDNALRFAVEELPDKSAYQFCYADHAPLPGCYDVEIGARENSGLLYVGLDRTTETENRLRYDVRHFMNDYPAQRMEVSVEDTGSGQKVYRDIVVDTPANAPDCSDFPEQDINRYTCLYNRQYLPSQPPSRPDLATLRDGLPKLVQAKENYDLIFAEEFNGVVAGAEDSEDCINSLATLDSSIWNYNNNPCENVDRLGEPCENIEDGHYRMSITSRCDSRINTEGKFAYQYGYLETKITANMGGQQFFNLFTLVAGNPKRPSRFSHKKYGIVLDDHEKLNKFLETEIDILEHYPNHRRWFSHQYYNWEPLVFLEDIWPRRTTRDMYICSQGPSGYEGLYFFPDLDPDTFLECGLTSVRDVTVTLGQEWTPRGYRYFIKVDGWHQQLVTFPQDNVAVEYREGSTEEGEVSFTGRTSYTTASGVQRAQFFELLDPDDSDSYLEQVSLAHMPLDLHVFAWGNPPPPEDARVRANTIHTKFRVDYIRIFQPGNRYLDMEPAYDQPVDADRLPGGASDLGTLAAAAEGTRTDSLNGTNDTVDYAVFTLGQSLRVTLELDELDYDADLFLEDAGGSVLHRSTASGTADERISEVLDAGSWYIRIQAKEAGTNDYELHYAVTAS